METAEAAKQVTQRVRTAKQEATASKGGLQSARNSPPVAEGGQHMISEPTAALQLAGNGTIRHHLQSC
jgi:hypothetical protein